LTGAPMSGSPPLAGPLRAVADAVAETGWMAELCDPAWRLVWISPELCKQLREHDPARLGIGGHIVASRALEPFARSLRTEAARGWLARNVPFMLDHTEGGRAALRDMVQQHFAPVVDAAQPRPAPLRWAMHTSYDMRAFSGQITGLGERINDERGRVVGYLFVYAPGLPASVLGLVTSGHPGVFERLAALAKPGARNGAVLFADLQASGVLARRLPSAIYFDFVRRLFSLVDDAVIQLGGVVGKHAGDGVSAFFLAEGLGSDSAAARAAVEAATAVRRAATQAAGEHDAIAASEGLVNVGLHWGWGLYIGQVVTGGRLEVSALGDPVNECARIQAVARDGAVLATKMVLERLTPEDARTVGLDVSALRYRPLAELAHGDAKALRDAGGLPVCELPAPPRRGV
jgi:class 3 adenylate cyclase